MLQTVLSSGNESGRPLLIGFRLAKGTQPFHVFDFTRMANVPCPTHANEVTTYVSRSPKSEVRGPIRTSGLGHREEVVTSQA